MKRLLTIALVSGFSLMAFQPALVYGQQDRGAANREAAQARAQEAREKAQDRVANIKQEVEDRKAQIKQDVCERRAERLEAAMPRMATGATSVKTAIDTVYERVQGFYESGQLTVSNYDELVANIEVAKAESEVTLTAIDEYDFAIDCENEEIGQQLDAYRSVVREAKDSLKVYRAELVTLISSLRAEAAEENATDETEAESEQEQETEGTEEGTTEEEPAEGVENETQQ